MRRGVGTRVGEGGRGAEGAAVVAAALWLSSDLRSIAGELPRDETSSKKRKKRKRERREGQRSRRETE